MSRLLFENQPKEICCLLSGNASKGKFLWRDKLQDHTNKGKERRKRRSKEEERRVRKQTNKKKQWLHSYSFYIKLLDGKGPFASNAFKNPARYKYLYKLTMFVWGWMEMIPN